MRARAMRVVFSGLVLLILGREVNAQDFADVRNTAKDSIFFVQAMVHDRGEAVEHLVDTATGFVVTCRGHFLTAAHIIRTAGANQEMKYYASPGPRDSQRFGLDLIKSDQDLDVALFGLPPSRNWIPLIIATSSRVPDDAKIMVLGFGNGGDLGSSQGTIRNHFAKNERFSKCRSIMATAVGQLSIFPGAL
jgi:hypothetical protein